MTGKWKKAERKVGKFLGNPLTQTFAAAAIGLMINDMTEYALFDLPDGTNPVCSIDPYCRKLNDNELALTRSVFGDKVDTKYVKIFTRPMWPVSLHLPKGVVAFVATGDNIHSKLGGELSRDMSDMKAQYAGTAVGSIFIHEMTHIWQHQHYGSAETGRKREKDYAQAEKKLGDKFQLRALYQLDLYDYPTFDEFGIEQQAEIVADYKTMHDFIKNLYSAPGYNPYW